MQNPIDQYVDIRSNGLTIKTRYWEAGEGSTVLLIHGLGGYVENWELNIAALAEHHHVYAFDMVGFGRSDKPDTDYSIPALTRFTQAFMDTLHLEEATVVGHSLGGAIALNLELQFAEKVNKLLLVSSGGFGREVATAFRVLSLPLIGSLLMRPNRKAIARGLKLAFYDEALVTEERIEHGYQMASLPGLTHTFLATIRASTNFLGFKASAIDPILNNLNQITVPTLAVFGKQDPAIPLSHTEVAQNRIADCQCHIFDQCAHWPQIEHVEEFNQLALEFLAE